MEKIQFEIFEKKANEIHDFKYQYDKNTFKGTNKKTFIICPEHGGFWQRALNHIKRKHGCPKCKGVKLAQYWKKSKNSFTQEAQIAHNYKYTYEKTIYINSKTKIEITCLIHGPFWQIPINHLYKKRGCPKCKGGIKLTTEEFILKASHKFQNKFDYSSVNYKNAQTRITIICPIHGKFKQSPMVHLQSTYGCKKCFLENFDQGISKSSQIWLNSLNNSNIEREYEFQINNRHIIVDGFDKTTNTIYEYYGSFWHGNPKIYNPDDINKVCNKKFGDLYKETINRELILINQGYKLITIWGP
jgi:hypothetical protein